MEINRYQELTLDTAIYPDAGTGNINEFSYLALGLVGEAGEVAEKVKKRIRDGKFDQELFQKELGDVFYYLCRLCSASNIQASTILDLNFNKLQDRKARGVLGGSGDNR